MQIRSARRRLFWQKFFSGMVSVRQKGLKQAACGRAAKRTGARQISAVPLSFLLCGSNFSPEKGGCQAPCGAWHYYEKVYWQVLWQQLLLNYYDIYRNGET